MTETRPRLVAAFALLTFVVTACRLSASGPESAPTSSPLPTDAEVDAGDGWASPDASLPDDHACYALAKEGLSDGCSSCCTDVYPGEWATAWDSLRACACRKPEPTCAKVCGDAYCAGALASDDASPACAACLVEAWNGADHDCSVAWGTRCNADDRCVAFTSCTMACDPAPNAVDGGAR